MAHPSPRIVAPKLKSSANSREVKPSLEWLIHPTSKSEFFERYFEKKPLVVKREQADHLRNLRSQDDIDHVRTTVDRGTDKSIRTNAGREPSTEDYTLGDQLPGARVAQLCR